MNSTGGAAGICSHRFTAREASAVHLFQPISIHSKITKDLKLTWFLRRACHSFPAQEQQLGLRGSGRETKKEFYLSNKFRVNKTNFLVWTQSTLGCLILRSISSDIVEPMLQTIPRPFINKCITERYPQLVFKQGSAIARETWAVNFPWPWLRHRKTFQEPN